jgi:GT2 family glycosyltransferase
MDSFFKNNAKCAVQAFSIFWELTPCNSHIAYEEKMRVKSFVGCGHAWNIEAWKSIQNYPDWFVFYGEEDFASYQLFKKGWEVHYNPEVLVQHRVNIKSRSKNKDYRLRLRRSLRSGWYLYILFYPIKTVPRKFFYTL